MSEEAWHLVKDTPEGHRLHRQPAPAGGAGRRRSRTCAAASSRARSSRSRACTFEVGDEVRVHRRRVRELLRHGRRGEAGQAEAQGEGLDLRPRDAASSSTSRRSRSAESQTRDRHASSRTRDQRRAMKKITGYIKLQLPAGKANPSPPVGPALGQHGVNIMGFCKEFNAQDAPRRAT